MRKTIYLVIALLWLPFLAQSQTIPLGSPIIQDYLRRQQLLGNFDSTFSFNYRPIVVGRNGVKIDSTIFDSKEYFGEEIYFLKKRGVFKLLPAEFRTAYDNKIPDSRNDGAMIRAKGIQTYLSAGFFSEIGPLTIQFKPEFVFADNDKFPGFPSIHFDNVWESRYIFYNRIDQPERYGTENYSKVLPGQSSIRLNQWGLSLGLSTENIWWGPSIRNSIMMSNNAQGFAHLTLNTQRPLKTPIGSFEAQIIAGRLEASDFDPPATARIARGSSLFVPKKDDWRYFQGLTFSYSPKWIKGLSVGFTRWVQQYNETAREANDYFPVFDNLFRQNEKDEFGLELQQDQAAGIFGRWVWYDSKAEFYFEFAKNDAAVNFRDLVVDSNHSRAYTVGLNKLFETNKKDAYIQFNFEWTQTSQTESRLFRNALSWYIHSNVRHGYTNNGEVLGSALGPGGNSQYLEVSWVKGLKKIGGAIERFSHNNDFVTLAFDGSRDFTRYWVDYSIYGFIDWKFDRFLLSGSMFYTKSLNYQWELEFDPNATPFQYTPGVDLDNLNIDLKVAFLF
jgi:hypothetical protein